MRRATVAKLASLFHAPGRMSKWAGNGTGMDSKTHAAPSTSRAVHTDITSDNVTFYRSNPTKTRELASKTPLARVGAHRKTRTRDWNRVESSRVAPNHLNLYNTTRNEASYFEAATPINTQKWKVSQAITTILVLTSPCIACLITSCESVAL